MSNLFNSIPIKATQYSRFNLDHTVKSTIDWGDIQPFYTDFVQPGDTKKIGINMLFKTMPLLAPIMHDVNIYAHFFFVPLRLLMSNYENFITGGASGDLPGEELPEFPYYIVSDNNHNFYSHMGNGSLVDYFNFPTHYLGKESANDTTKIEYRLPKILFNAYNLIWNEYYRDENIESEIHFDNTPSHVNCNTSVFSSWFQVRKHSYFKDYFTSALPNPQRGPSVPLFMNDVTVDMRYRGDTVSSNVKLRIASNGSESPYGAGSLSVLGSSSSDGRELQYEGTVGLNKRMVVGIDNSANLQGVLNASSLTVNDLRWSVAIQKYFEKMNRGGFRYKEFLFNFFQTHLPDDTAQRPVFLGGTKQPFIVTEVINTNSGSNDAGKPLGFQGGNGYSMNQSYVFKRRFAEYGVIMGLVFIQPRAGYFQGYPRIWDIKDRFDLPNPMFANLGEQEIKKKELYYDFRSDQKTNDSTFGYTPRYAEWKTRFDEVHGEFRSTLLYWHLARKFDGAMSLGPSFIHTNAGDLNRVFPVEVINDVNVPSHSHFYYQVRINERCTRALPYFGVPSL